MNTKLAAALLKPCNRRGGSAQTGTYGCGLGRIGLLSLILAVWTCAETVSATVFHAGTAQELQTALSLAASNGEDDTIYLAAGIYAGNFTFNTSEAQSLTIQAESNTLPGQVVLDGQQAGCVLNLNAGTVAANLAVNGITVKNGRGVPAGGLAGITAGTITIRQCVLHNSTAGSGNYSYNGIYYISGGNFWLHGESSVNLTETQISGGQPFRGSYGSMGGYGAGYLNSTETVRMERNDVKGNVNGINISAEVIDFTGNRVTDNTENQNGMSFSAPNCRLTGNDFLRNSASNPISVYGGNEALLINNRFIQNTNQSGNSSGGAVSVNGNLVVCNNNLFQANISAAAGGAVALSGWGRIACANNLVVSNTAGSYGGGVYVTYGATNWIVNNTIYGNTASQGGGLYLDTGGSSSTSSNYVHNNIIWGNTASTAGADVYVVSGGALRSLYNNNFHGMTGLWDLAVNNIDVAPLFVDALRGDYHLRANSLCLNAGNNAAPGLPLVDKDGNVRVGNGIVDIGCYEHATTDWHPADANTNWVLTISEFNAYAQAWTNNAAWGTGPNPVPMDYVTRAGFLFQTNGGAYQNAGGGKPLNWKP